MCVRACDPCMCDCSEPVRVLIPLWPCLSWEGRPRAWRCTTPTPQGPWPRWGLPQAGRVHTGGHRTRRESQPAEGFPGMSLTCGGRVSLGITVLCRDPSLQRGLRSRVLVVWAAESGAQSPQGMQLSHCPPGPLLASAPQESGALEFRAAPDSYMAFVSPWASLGRLHSCLGPHPWGWRR